MVFEQEAAFETALINLLIEKYGWEPEILRYKTEEDLIQNWKQILFENNREVDRLNDVPLTDGEMQQILDQITRLRTPLKLKISVMISFFASSASSGVILPYLAIRFKIKFFLSFALSG